MQWILFYKSKILLSGNNYKKKTPFPFPESTIFINIIPSGCVDSVNTIVLNVITRRISQNILVEVLMQCEISRFLTIKALANHEIKSSTIFWSKITLNKLIQWYKIIWNCFQSLTPTTYYSAHCRLSNAINLHKPYPYPQSP